MDMRIDSALIRAERQKRGWSQEQLAAATGLGVRTIQRLEASGIASGESAQSLAAVFEVPVARLAVVDTATASPIRARLWAAGGAAAIALVFAILLVPRANANGVALEVGVDTDATGISKMNLEVEDGHQTEIKLEKDLRLLLTPTVQKDGLVLISAEIYGWDGTDYKLASKPRVLTRNGQDTKLRLELGGGRAVRITITPRSR